MTDIQLAIVIGVGVLVLSFVFYFIFAFGASYFVYTRTLKRQGKEDWSREPKLDGIQKDIFSRGMEWHKENVYAKKDVHIVNDSLNLYGEYYDFGSDKAVIILSGRTESLTYGYYFASPYARSGLNVLVIDPRAHGLSDGEFNTVGFEESKDAVAWAKFLHDEMGVTSIVFHGICIGGAAGTYALTSENCPDYIDGIVVEGLFPTFGESLRNHMIEQKRPMFLISGFINRWMIHYTGYDMEHGPLHIIDKLKKPILFIHSKEDLYSTPEYAEKLYAICGAENKKIVWFEHGKHSMLRPNDESKYDNAVCDFVENIYSSVKI